MKKEKIIEFKMLLKSEIRKTYLSLSYEILNGYGILTDEGIGSVSIVYSTTSYLKEVIGKNQDEAKSLNHKWNASEWEGYFDTENLQAMNAMLFENLLLIDSDKFVKTKLLLIEMMLEALVELKEEKLFSDRDESFILRFGMLGYDAIDDEIMWISKINNKKNSSEFIEYRQLSNDKNYCIDNNTVEKTMSSLNK